jgi:hypothetical protein
MAIALNVVVFWGFSITYFAPLLSQQSAFGGSVADLPLIVHLHGLSFFLWYLLVLLQAGLIASSNYRPHRRFGMVSVALVAIMVVTGLIIVTVNIHQPLQPGEPPIWILFGPAILSTLMLFVVFYTLAIRNRKRSDFHKRYIVVASTAVLGAAAFRVLLGILDPNLGNIPAGILLTNVFIIAGMLHDRYVDGKVHRAYWTGIIVCASTEVLFLALPHTAIGQAYLRVLGGIGAHLKFLYE